MDLELLQQIFDALPSGVVVIIKLEDSIVEEEKEGELGKDKIISEGESVMGGGGGSGSVPLDGILQGPLTP